MTFRRYAAERVGITVLVLFLCACFCYVCFHVIGIPVRTGSWLPDHLARYHRYRNESFGGFLWQYVDHASLGHDLATGRDITGYVADLAPPTLSVASGALVVAVLVGLPLGYAWSRWGEVRFFATPFVYLMFGLIQVWLAIFLQWQLGFNAGIFPISGYCTFTVATSRFDDCGGPVQWAYHLILPSIVLGYLLAAVHAVVVRRLAVGVRRAAEEPTDRHTEAGRVARVHMRTAYGKLIARNWFWLIGATLFVETLFNLGGLASYMLGSLNGSYPEWAEGILMFTALITVGGWLVVDLIGAAVSPHWREL